jgi:hypothetical protein
MLEVLVHLIIEAHGAWGWFEERSLVARVQELRGRGELMWPEDFKRAKKPDAENGAFFLRAAHKALDTSGEDWQKLEAMKLALPLSQEDAAVLERLVVANVESLRLVESARNLREMDWGIKMATPMIQTSLPDLQSLARLRRLVDAQVTLALHKGDSAKAAGAISDLMTISRGADGMGFLVGHMLSLSAQTSAAERAAALAQALERADQATAESIAKLINELLEEKDLRDGWRRGLVGERAVFTEVVLDFENMRLLPREITRGPMGVLVRPFIVRDGMFMLWHLEQLMRAVDAKDLGAYVRATAEGRKLEEGMCFQKLHILSVQVMPAHEKVARRHFLVLADRRMAAMALAARLYELEHGRLPARLEELVPKYLPAVPDDPMADGKKMGYVAGEEQPKLYSVGENLADDGGSETPLLLAKEKSRYQQEDLVVHLKRRK